MLVNNIGENYSKYPVDQFRKTFHLTHEQIKKSAADIIATANTMENQ